MTYDNELEALIYDCGGPERVAEAVGIAKTSVWKWIRKGHLPLTDLYGRTSHSETLARMQRAGRMSATEIRRIGLKV